MMTLAVWKNTRRVDHVDLGKFHIRWRSKPSDLADLKVFDADVTAFAAANNNFDRVTVLGRLLQQTTAYRTLGPNVFPDRYSNAVNALHMAVTNDLNQICGALQPARTADILAASSVHPVLAPKNVALNIFYLVPVGAAPSALELLGVDVRISAHINQANNAPGYEQAGITFYRTNAAAVVARQTAAGQSILLPVAADVPVASRGRFADGGNGGPRLITYCNASGGAAKSIDVVYLDHYDQADVQGRTFRAGVDYGGSIPARPIVTVTLNPPADGNATYPTTLAHELGHALTSDPDHSLDASCLMAGGAIRNGNNTLSPGLIGWFRNNPWT
jgi:hypothetical protein